ncbi:hypothetical protein [Streptomyces sp. 35G-GA-8]|uniref:hypothetical protein n=1 Tax=Streptomyces sp. 35G-GA-8 TaxID=2939434 RepID=UPI00201F4092|nr:hypothetical protein [Streptomyces sp. 35G-GA-8]MCL7379758.1 hypothetical protein [Streptomyces sp. 35G-GA-8]
MIPPDERSAETKPGDAVRSPLGSERGQLPCPAELEQHSVELTSALEEDRSDLDAAREANRDLTRALNQRG